MRPILTVQRMNPFRRLKFLPWIPLLQVAAIATVCVAVLEAALVAAVYLSPLLNRMFQQMMSTVLAVAVLGAIAYGLGALALLLIERIHPGIRLNAGVLWTLVACLLLAVWLKSLLPIPGLMGLNELSLAGVTLGVFTTGRRYWRY